MDIARILSVVREPAGPDGGARAAAFAVGQRFDGRVLQLLEDEALLVALGDRQVVARSAVPLRVGQEIRVEVVRVGETVELRLEPQVTPSSEEGERNYAMAALLIARGHGSTPAPDLGGLLRALAASRAAGSAGTSASVFETLSRLIQPLLPGGDTQALAAALRTWVEQSGTLFEAHAGRTLTAQPTPGREAALAALDGDLKTLLARLASASGDVESREAGGPGVEAANVAAQLLQRQADFAYRWLVLGEAAYDVAAEMPAGEAPVRLVFRREQGGGGTDGRRRVTSVSVLVPSPVLGSIEANARFEGRALHTTFYVERDTTFDAVSSRLERLKPALQSLFPAVTFEVRVDRDRLNRRPGPLDAPPLPGGSILSVRA